MARLQLNAIVQVCDMRIGLALDPEATQARPPVCSLDARCGGLLRAFAVPLFPTGAEHVGELFLKEGNSTPPGQRLSAQDLLGDISELSLSGRRKPLTPETEPFPCEPLCASRNQLVRGGAAVDQHWDSKVDRRSGGYADHQPGTLCSSD